MAVEWKKLVFDDEVILNALLSAKGDIIYASAVNTPARLAIGGDNQILRVATDIPAWEALGAPTAHKASHEDGGGDEISVIDLSGLLADDQHVLDAEVTLVIEATPLNDLAAADGAIDFNLQEATDLVIMTVANEAALPAADVALGQLCWATGELSLHVCTAIA